MKRAWDSIGLAISIAGLGYLVLWLTGWSGRMTVSPALHTAGLAAAGFAVVSLLLRVLGRRRPATVGNDTVFIPRTSAVIFRPTRRKPARPPSRVKARAHFGLRGKPH
jgi:hypothetical protein